MVLEFDFERMEELLKSFHSITGLRYSLMDKAGSIMCTSSDLSGFCNRINASPEGHARCEHCDADAIERVNGLGADHLIYRCHAGLTEAVIPIRYHGQVLGYIFLGQIRPGEPEECWRHTLGRISWMQGAEELLPAFCRLVHMEEKGIAACANILKTCSSYIWMEGVLRSTSMTEEQLLNHYISEHYAQPLTLSGIASALSMSKTKLCSIASRQGTTVIAMLQAKRMEEAKRLLRRRNDRIAEVAAQVGIPDHNYFTKLFKAHTGETPRAYQKRHAKAAQRQ